MALSFREVKECGPSSLNNISSPVCPGPVLMTSSPHRNALKQKAARGRAHFISRSLFLSLIPFLSLSEKIRQSFTLPFPYLGRILSLLSLCACLTITVLCLFSQTFISSHFAKASITFIIAHTNSYWFQQNLNPKRLCCTTRPTPFADVNDTSSHAARFLIKIFDSSVSLAKPRMSYNFHMMCFLGTEGTFTGQLWVFNRCVFRQGLWHADHWFDFMNWKLFLPLKFSRKQTRGLKYETSSLCF